MICLLLTHNDLSCETLMTSQTELTGHFRDINYMEIMEINQIKIKRIQT